MTSFAEHFAQDRRLTILKLLAQAPEYTANEYLLHSALPNYGHSVSRDRVRTDLAWLAEQELVRVDNGTASMQVAQLTSRGADVAAGRATVPGVKRPVPGDN